MGIAAEARMAMMATVMMSSTRVTPASGLDARVRECGPLGKLRAG
jgi:hypothetical protein